MNFKTVYDIRREEEKEALSITYWKVRIMGYIFTSVFLVFGFFIAMGGIHKSDWSCLSSTVECVLVAAIPWFIFYRASKRMADAQSKIEERTLTFTEEGLRCQNSSEDSFMKWEGFSSFSEGKKVVILYMPSGQRVTLAKRLFTEDQVDELLSVLESRVKKGIVT